MHAVLELELRLLAELALVGDLRLGGARLLLSRAARNLLSLEVLLDAQEHVLQLGVGLGLDLELLVLRLHLRLELRQARRRRLLRRLRHVLHGVVVAALGNGVERVGVLQKCGVSRGRRRAERAPARGE